MKAGVGVGRVVECAFVIHQRTEVPEAPLIQDPITATTTITPE